jgi:ubiquinone/menaquinone biosynthesis C-methylase UbiE
MAKKKRAKTATTSEFLCGSNDDYPKHVRHLTANDPGVGMARIARRRMEQGHIKVDLHIQTADEFPLEDGQFDCVVSTLSWML